MFVSAITASAQNDVTSQYIQNADFSKGTPIAVGTRTYAKDIKEGEVANLVEVENWDIPENGDARAGGLIAFGSGVWIGSEDYVAPATNSDGENTGNILGLVGVWSGTAQYTQDVTLPAGTYTLVLGVYNSVGGTTAFVKNLIGFIEDGGDEHLAETTVYAVNTWKYEFITFTLGTETSGKFTLGYQGSNVGSGSAQHLFLSGIQLFDGEVDAAAYEEAKLAKLLSLEAQALLDSEDYSIITGQEREDLENAIGDDTAALKEALQAFKDARAAYQALADADATLNNWLAQGVELPYADQSKKPAAASATASTAADAQQKADELLAGLRAYYESNALAEAIPGAVNKTDLIYNFDATDGNNGWDIEGNMNDPRNTESWTDALGNHEYMYFDGGNWGASAWTTTCSQAIILPAGQYLLTAKGRASTQVVATMSVGDVSVELDHVGNAGNIFNRGWADSYLEFSNETDGDVTIVISATTENVHEWFSFGDFRLMQLADTPTGITNVKTEKAAAPVYNLAGQQVRNAQKGIFIQNGKKVIK